MKKPTFLRACLLAASLIMARQVATETLVIVVEDIRQADGTLLVQVLASQNQFEGKEEAEVQLSAVAVEGSLTLIAEDLPAGEYAVKVMQDVNDNRQLDANWVGIPREPWGFSNNARGRFGPARWQDAQFRLEDEVTQVISLVHP